MMNKTRNNSLRAWMTVICAAAFCLLSTQTAWGQSTTQGVKVGSADVKTVDGVEVTSGDIKDATSGSTVTVTVEPKENKVARVTVSSTTINVSSITVASDGDATSINAGSTLQMSATVTPTYANNQTVTWSVTNANGSNATINSESGLLSTGTAPGTVTVTATAADGGGATGTKTITITTIPLTDAMVQDIAAQTYTGSQLTPTVTVTDGSKTLTLNTDYTVTYGANVNVADGGSVIVTGKGAYSGTIVKNFTISQKALTITAKAQTIAYGSSISSTTSDVTVEGLVTGDELNAITLAKTATDYSASAYEGNITATGAVVKIGETDVTANYSITYNAGNLTINKAASAVTTAPIGQTSLTYTGEALELVNATSAACEGGTLVYSKTSDGTYGAANTITETNAGTYSFWYKVQGDANHSDTAPVQVTGVTINKVAATLTCSTDALSFTASQGANSTVTKTSVSCTGGTISVSSGTEANCTVGYSDGTITVTRVSTAAFTGTEITVSVTPDGNHTAPSNVTFNVSAVAYTPPYTMAANATSSGKGKLICTDGHIHAYNADADCTAARVAMIVYVGATGNSTYSHGLALALADANNGSNWKKSKGITDNSVQYTSSSSFGSEDGLTYQTTDRKNSTWPAFNAAASYSATAPANTSGWFLASAYQWNLMINGAGSYSSLRDGFSGVGGTNMQSKYYWSCTEYNVNFAWAYNFTSGNWSNYGKMNSGYVRSALAF